MDDAIVTLTMLFAIFTKAAINDKRRLIGSMFPEKIDFDALQHRTAMVSATLQFICLIKKELKDKKKPT
ncbi:MAG: hypothetical protein EOO45_20360 [Flavobacterium sp.]|nr:MAG: hypothetical protein EOO45_20360 [Flavobacterium sp.]